MFCAEVQEYTFKVVCGLTGWWAGVCVCVCRFLKHLIFLIKYYFVYFNNFNNMN